MIDSKKIMIGNHILIKGKVQTVNQITEEGVNGFHNEGIGGMNYEEDFNGKFEDCEGILITEE